MKKDNYRTLNETKDKLINLLSIDDAVQKLKKAKSNELIIFVGAGVSVTSPSCSPTWNSLLERAINSIKKAHSGIADFYNLIIHRSNKIKPELLCQLLYNNLHGDFFTFLDILNMGKPNNNHHNIASVAREYKIPAILTTNFDTYIEKSLCEADLKYKLYINSAPRSLRKSLNSKSIDRKYLPLIKLHGSLDERATIILTLRQTGRNLKKDLSELLQYVFSYYTVLLVGYSGNDDDIFPVILNNAKSAKKVYWVLYDKNSLTDNIQAFAMKCPNCSLVALLKDTNKDEVNIFEKLLNEEIAKKYHEEQALIDYQNEFLYKWASSINEIAWKNFFSELILLLDPSKDEVAFVAEQSYKIIRENKDPSLVTKALMNHGISMVVLNEYEKAIESLLKAVDQYMIWGRHREVIECLSMMVAKIPIKWEWRGNDPLFWTSWLSGKTYDPYCLGLSNYAEGLFFLKDGRIKLSKERLLVAAGYAKKCGDSITLVNCLESLNRIFSITKEKHLEEQCLIAAYKIKNALGVNKSDIDIENMDSIIIDMCESYAKIETRSLIVGEIVIFLVFCIITAILAWIISPNLRVGILSWSLGALTWIVVKVWNVAKKFRYTSIDRS